MNKFLPSTRSAGAASGRAPAGRRLRCGRLEFDSAPSTPTTTSTTAPPRRPTRPPGRHHARHHGGDARRPDAHRAPVRARVTRRPTNRSRCSSRCTAAPAPAVSSSARAGSTTSQPRTGSSSSTPTASARRRGGSAAHVERRHLLRCRGQAVRRRRDLPAHARAAAVSRVPTSIPTASSRPVTRTG